MTGDGGVRPSDARLVIAAFLVGEVGLLLIAVSAIRNLVSLFAVGGVLLVGSITLFQQRKTSFNRQDDGVARWVKESNWDDWRFLKSAANQAGIPFAVLVVIQVCVIVILMAAWLTAR